MARAKKENPALYTQKPKIIKQPTVHDGDGKAPSARQVFEGEFNVRRQKLYDEMFESYPQFMDDMIFQKLLKQFSIMLEQEERLCKFIDENGWSYKKFSSAGDETYSAHPEGAKLQKLQTDITRIGKQLLMFERNMKEDTGDERENLLA